MKFLTPKQLMLTLGGITIFGMFVATTKKVITPLLLSPREKVVAAAESQLGKDDASKYWKDVMPETTYWPINWCGAFALWSLHQAGLAKNWFWENGIGFLYRLPQTKNPKPGDVAYFNNMQHQAVVKSVNANGTITLINGNSVNKKVAESTVDKKAVTAFYSIEPLLEKKNG